MDRVFKLLTKLSVDPFEHAAFTARGQEAALTDEGRAALGRARSPEAQAEIAGGAWSRCAWIADPGPDPDEDPDPPGRKAQDPRTGSRLPCGGRARI
ncbi:hypothetical protein BE17_21030 [Sorangium cellulosum]|uniref:Uncharacterized protein n=1 Tax=Sorangium cellulosum TaxID=56 RepID=A0A150R1P8_SORCE|nr:hypothetical protein BE17_21030 [Sorangium cellulosum]